jgi:putative tricarboxylic transport membrane protein
MLSRDFVGGLATIVIGAVYLYFAYQLRASALDDSMGPGGMPRIYGWLLVGLGTILVVQAVIASRAMATASAPPPEKGEWEGQGRKVAYAAGLLGRASAYLFVVQSLGYVLTIALLIITATIYLGGGISGRVVAIGIGGAICLWAMFVVGLGVRMPAGVLGSIGF